MGNAADLAPKLGPRAARVAARRDLACVVAIALAAWLAGTAFDLGEALYRWTRRVEQLQVDELPVTLLVLAIGLSWFAWRRYRDAQHELDRCRALEAHAEQLLADNRRLANRAFEAQEDERRKLARELHDELGQYLNAIALDAARIRDLSAGKLPEAHRVSLALLRSAAYVYRQIRRMTRGLRPIGLDEFGLPGALEICVEAWRERLPHATFSLAIEGDFTGLSDALNITLYRLVQEGLVNVSKFARMSRVQIFLVRTPQEPLDVQGACTAGTLRESPHAGGCADRDEIVVTMADDGPGVDLDSPRAGLGLVGMRERVEALGGEFQLASRPGEGFLFCARVPVYAGLAAPAAN